MGIPEARPNDFRLTPPTLLPTSCISPAAIPNTQSQEVGYRDQLHHAGELL